MPLGLWGERFEENPVTTVGGNVAAGLQPTIVLNANAGSTATAVFTATSNDRCGQINCTSGGTGQAVGTWAVVTFATAFAKAPVVLVSGYDSATVGAAFVVSATSTTTFTIACAAATGTNTNPKVFYVVLGSGT
jgi:hypothetical protein